MFIRNIFSCPPTQRPTENNGPVLGKTESQKVIPKGEATIPLA